MIATYHAPPPVFCYCLLLLVVFLLVWRFLVVGSESVLKNWSEKWCYSILFQVWATRKLSPGARVFEKDLLWQEL